MEQNSNKSMVWIVVVVIILIVLGIWFFSTRDGASVTPTDEETSEEMANTYGRILIDDQFPGKVVYVSSATLPRNGFVVIHKDQAGKPGAVIGSRYFKKGTNPGTIDLSESTIEGGTYYAMLHGDEDANSTFDATKDLPLNDKSGNPVMRTFKVTKDVTPIKG